MEAFEVLIGKDLGDYYSIIGTSYSDVQVVETGTEHVNASWLTIQTVKKVLSAGKLVTIKKSTNPDHIEYRPEDLIISNSNGIEQIKNAALNQVIKLMHQNIICVSIIDAMDYLDCYMKLMNNGIFITNENREDKYFEIIEKAQSIDEPALLNENASYEEEEKYIREKKEYDLAQDNLSTLEKYLNGYDKLSKIRFVNGVLQKVKQAIINSNTKEEIDKALDDYAAEIAKFNDKE